MSEAARRGAWAWGLAATSYLALAIAVSWPAVTDPGGRLIAHENGDAWPNLWAYRWFADELSAGRLPLQVDQIRHPDGGTLYVVDTLDALLAAPLVPAIGPVASYTLLVWFNLLLASLGAFGLVRHVTGAAAPAWLGGLIYGFSPYLMGAVASGVTELNTAGWLPLAAWMLLRAGEGGRLRHGLAAGACTGLAALGCLYYGMAAGLLALLLVGHGLLARRPRWSPRRAALPLVAAALVVASSVGPIYGWLRASLGSGDITLLQRTPHADAYRGDWRWASPVTDPANLLRPGKLTAGRPASENTVFHVTYPGWAVLALALIAVIARRRTGEAGLWATAALAFGVLSLGEHLQLAGETARIGDAWVALPAAALKRVLPPAALGTLYYRYFVVVTLALAVLAGLGWRAAARALPARARGVALAGIALVVLAETWWLSPPPLPLPTADAAVPSYYRELDAAPGSFAVLDMPIGFENRVHERYIYYAAIHGQRVPYGVSEMMADEVKLWPVVQELTSWTHDWRAGGGPGALASSLAPLQRHGFERLVVHRGPLRARVTEHRARRDMLEALAARLGDPLHSDEELVVFSIPAATASAAGERASR